MVWTALRDELRGPDANQVSEIVERLATVMELVRGAALRADAGLDVTVAAGRFGRVRVASGGVAAPPDPAPSRRASVPERPSGPRPLSRSADRGPADGASAPASADEALWVGALQEEIERSERFGTPLSLLLAELEDASRVVAVETPDDAMSTFGRFAQAVRGVTRRQDILVSETEARAWIIARDTGRTGARALGSRIVGAVRDAGHWRGVPMAASVGVVVLGEDGRTPAGTVDRRGGGGVVRGDRRRQRARRYAAGESGGSADGPGSRILNRRLPPGQRDGADRGDPAGLHRSRGGLGEVPVGSVGVRPAVDHGEPPWCGRGSRSPPGYRISACGSRCPPWWA